MNAPDPHPRRADKFVAYDKHTGHYWALDQTALNVFCVHCRRWMTDYTLINACRPPAHDEAGGQG